MSDIKAIAERKVNVARMLEGLMMCNVYGKSPEQLANLEVSIAKARIEYNSAQTAYENYIEAEVAKSA